MKNKDQKIEQLAERWWNEFMADDNANDTQTFYLERIAELEEELKHFKNYADHTQFCSWKNNGNGDCDCGYKRN